MGAWGFGSFDNDDAMDFLAELTESEDLSLIREALANVVSSHQYLEAPHASQAIVAAEFIIAILHQPTVAALKFEKIPRWLALVPHMSSPNLSLKLERR